MVKYSTTDEDKNKRIPIETQDATPAEELHNSIWPSTDIDAFVRHLDKGGNEILNVRHGPKHDTCLHR